MVNLPGSLWLIEATAVAGERCNYPTGTKHALLVFAKADAREAAFTLMRESADSHGWEDIAMIRSGELPAGEADIEEEEILAAAMNALQRGCSIVVHDISG